MLATFVIGLREGLEASLIVGIIAAFLKRNGRQSDMWALGVGVGLALTLCVGVGVALHVAEDSLPQRQQEGLETIIGLVAVAFVSWMILWMRRHAHELKRDIEAQASAALVAGSATALVVMAFLAVLREGFETVVFLLAAFTASTSPGSAGLGAALGILLAVVIGWGIYRGGVRLDLARFFRVTAVVLVLVAAGLLATAAHTAHEAGWLTSMQHQMFDISWLVDPGSVRAALLTGMFGLQAQPVTAEVLAWVLYAVPMLFVVLWKQPNRTRPRPAAAVAS